VLSVVLMGAATVAIGLLPSYQSIGIWAPVLLILIRLFQGFSVGGEFVGSVTYLVETAEEHRRGLAGSVANIGATIGMLLAAPAGAVTQMSSGHSQLWRWPFLFGGLLAFVGYVLRRHLPPEEELVPAEPQLPSRSAASKQNGAVAHFAARWPAFQACREVPGTMILALLFTSGYGVSNYLIMVFLPTFGTEFARIPGGTALQINTAGQALVLVLVPFAGWLSDRWLRRRTMLGLAFLLQSAVAWELFRMVKTSGAGGLWAAQLILAGLLALVMGAAPAMLAEQFSRGYRVSAHALVLNVGIGIAGGSAPLVAVALIGVMHTTMAPAIYLLFACLVSGITVLMLSDRSRTKLDTST